MNDEKRVASQAPSGRSPNAWGRIVSLLLAGGLFFLAGAGCTTSDSAASRGTVNQAEAADTLATDTLAALADTLAPAEAARYAFRGRDLEGKDGPLAAIGYDLAHLYFAHRAFEQKEEPEGSFRAPGGARVASGRVLVDATARESGDRLKADLEALGLEGGAVAGPVVSGRLPIGALPEAAQLASLRSMRRSRPATRSSSASRARPPRSVGG